MFRWSLLYMWWRAFASPLCHAPPPMCAMTHGQGQSATPRAPSRARWSGFKRTHDHFSGRNTQRESRETSNRRIVLVNRPGTLHFTLCPRVGVAKWSIS